MRELVLTHEFETSVEITNFMYGYLQYKSKVYSAEHGPSPRSVGGASGGGNSGGGGGGGMLAGVLGSNNNDSIDSLFSFISTAGKSNKRKQSLLQNTKDHHGLREAIESGWWSRFDRKAMSGSMYGRDVDDLFVFDRNTQMRVREHVPGYIKIALKAMYDMWLNRCQPPRIHQQLQLFSKQKVGGSFLFAFFLFYFF